MTLDAPVILCALFFTIIAIILASVFLAKKPAPKKEQKQKEHEERSERVTEYHQPIVEQPAPAPVPKEVITEKKRAEPAPVVEAEVIPVQHTPVQVRWVLAIQCTLCFLDTIFGLSVHHSWVGLASLASRHEMRAVFVKHFSFLKCLRSRSTQFRFIARVFRRTDT